MAARLVATRTDRVYAGEERQGFFTVPVMQTKAVEVAWAPVGGCREYAGTGCAGDDSRDEVTP